MIFVITINVCKDFTDTPGARYINEGTYSGEEFRNKILEPKYKQALELEDVLFVDLDGGYGYATSFLEEAFGGLARIYDKIIILKILKLKSDDEPSLIEDIYGYIENARKKK